MTSSARTRTAGSILLWIVVALLGLVATLAVPTWRRRERHEQPRFTALAIPAAQRRSTRVWRVFDWTEVARVGAAQAVASPAYLSVDDRDQAVALDGRHYSIVTIDMDGRVAHVRPIPDAALKRSSIPLTDLAPGADGTTWLCGPVGDLVGLRVGGELSVLPRAYKVAALDSGVVAMSGPPRAELFSLYDAHGAPVRSFGILLENQARHKLALDGALAVDRGMRHLVYAPYSAGVLASFDEDGRARFLVTTVDRAPLPRLAATATGGLRVAEDAPAPVRLRDLALRDGRVHALVTLREEGRRRSVVDLYRASDGAYDESFELPGDCAEIAVGVHAAYGVCGGEVIVWRRPATDRGAALRRRPASPADGGREAA